MAEWLRQVFVGFVKLIDEGGGPGRTSVLSSCICYF